MISKLKLVITYLKKLIVYYKKVQKIITCSRNNNIIVFPNIIYITVIYCEVKKSYKNGYGRTDYSDYYVSIQFKYYLVQCVSH